MHVSKPTETTSTWSTDIRDIMATLSHIHYGSVTSVVRGSWYHETKK